MSGSSVVVLPHTAASVATARWQLTAELRQVGVTGPALSDAVLVLSELMGNAVRHARPLPGHRIRVRWSLTGGRAEISVTDGGATTRPRAGRAPVSSLGGRGLGIVDLLASSWGVRHGDGSTTVWAVLPLAGAQVQAARRCHGRHGRLARLAAG